jgi:hypothetical protein
MKAKKKKQRIDLLDTTLNKGKTSDRGAESGSQIVWLILRPLFI